MSYDNWRLVIGETQERTWGGNKYRFRVGQGQTDADPVFLELQSNTPLRRLIDNAVGDNIIRVVTYLSYYLVNPTFNHGDGDDIGSNFFWFPLDRLTETRYENLLGDLDDTNEDSDSDDEDDEEDASLPDFPIMSSIGEPIIDAAVSREYITQGQRSSIEERQALLQDEIEKRQRELVEEIEAWLEEGMNNSQFRGDFSQWAEQVGRFPAQFLLGGIYNERSRLEDIQEIFTTMDPVDSPEQLSPEILLRKLTSLTEDHPSLVNPAIEAFCLDQHDRGCNFHITKHRGYELKNNIVQCEHCGSDLYRAFRAGLDDRVRDAWMMGLLPELVTARIFENCEWAEDVIPHRMVQMETSEGVTSSVEVDVSVHTTEDEVLFFEVTSQRDALNRVITKKNKFRENGISYDGLIQLSLTDNREFIDFGDDTIAGGAWMISGLERPEFYDDLRDTLELDK